MREGVRRLLEAQAELELVAACEDLDSLLAAVDEHTPDVVLTDIRMPPTGTDEGIRAAEHAARRRTPTSASSCSASTPTRLRARAARAGLGAVAAYLLKERVSDIDQLLAAIREVAAGGSVIDPKVVEALVQPGSRPTSRRSALTPREREILAEMAQGKNNAAIAAALEPERAGRREAHQLDLLQAGPEPGARRRTGGSRRCCCSCPTRGADHPQPRVLAPSPGFSPQEENGHGGRSTGLRPRRRRSGPVPAGRGHRRRAHEWVRDGR